MQRFGVKVTVEGIGEQQDVAIYVTLERRVKFGQVTGLGEACQSCKGACGIRNGAQFGRNGRQARQGCNYAVAEFQPFFGNTCRLDFSFHLGHIDGHRALAFTGLAANTQFHRVGHLVRRKSIIP